MTHALYRTLLFTTAAILLVTCKKDDDEILPDPTPDPHPNTVVGLAFHFHFGTDSLDLTQNYVDDFAMPIHFNTVKFFMAMPYFLDDALDTVESFPNRYLLVDASEGATVRVVGELDGHLHILGFGLGVEVHANHEDPTLADPPLNDASMHWGWNPSQGYKFLVIEGKYDSDLSGTITGSDADFTYHCATDALYTMDSVMVHTDADNGGNVVLDLGVDMQHVIGGLNIATQPLGTGDTPETEMLMTNLASAITHED